MLFNFLLGLCLLHFVIGFETSKPRILYISDHEPTSLTINWEEPARVNGQILEYKIQLQKVYTLQIYNFIHRDPLKSFMKQRITGLEPYTQYNIRVQAMARDGNGEWSDMYPGITDVSGPGAPTIISATKSGTNEMLLRWKAPQKFYHSIDEYVVEISPQNSNHIRRTTFPQYLLEPVEGDNMAFYETHITDLEENVSYLVRLAGLTQSLFSNFKYRGNYSLEYLFQGLFPDTYGLKIINVVKFKLLE